MSEKSRAQRLAELPRAILDQYLASLTEAERERLNWELQWDWEWRGRPSQHAPSGEWIVWLILAGRGFGKTTSGVQWVRRRIKAGYGHTNIIVPTFGDIDKVLIDGEAGFIKAIPPSERPEWNGKKSAFIWPNGAKSIVFSAESPERLRGPEHDGLWCDELAAWQYMETWDLAMMGLRLGKSPQAVVTTTPKPIPEIKALIKDSTTIVTKGRTFDNAQNLAKPFLSKIITKYQGTRLGRQEIDGEILDDNPGALWKRSQIDATRISPAKLPRLLMVVVGVDPGGSSEEGADATGIVVVGRDSQDPPHFYVLADATLIGTPSEWGEMAVKCYHGNEANKIVAEKNFGGEMVGHVIQTTDRNVPFDLVTASRSKQARAEPISAIHEQGRIHHVGRFPQLEDELCDWVPGSGSKSPNRLDALVWAAYGCGAAGQTDTGLLDYFRAMRERG